MKKNTRAPVANPKSGRRRVLRLSHETVRVLSPTDLARAAGGEACVTTSWTSDQKTLDGNTTVKK